MYILSLTSSFPSPTYSFFTLSFFKFKLFLSRRQLSQFLVVFPFPLTSLTHFCIRFQTASYYLHWFILTTREVRSSLPSSVFSHFWLTTFTKRESIETPLELKWYSLFEYFFYHLCRRSIFVGFSIVCGLQTLSFTGKKSFLLSYANTFSFIPSSYSCFPFFPTLTFSFIPFLQFPSFLSITGIYSPSMLLLPLLFLSIAYLDAPYTAPSNLPSFV